MAETLSINFSLKNGVQVFEFNSYIYKIKSIIIIIDG